MTSTARRVLPTDPVRSIMVDGPATVDPGDSLLAVAEELVAGEIGAVLVRAPGGPTGLLSERDVVAALVAGGDLGDEQAGEVMTADLVSVGTGETIVAAGRRMAEAGVRHLPVRDGDAVVGLVSQRDVLAVLLAAAPD
ncbi:CBS domain-containing protein [Pseudonocardia hydrocarbonoxydans]|uniref:Inosine-5-monophosphate dehydrogenase n=1 Tax=Pseudonocardia hydrocarbonoxydans TaxID=76726 RepID=A0A4Y3WRU9_9PSEU|nr:CBS domain-containing protein [Pseudonocardia hydrocarbonoxydans]GEC20086.1 inosine-5-monophosphate dehydrogenase [Pseudonocardia hydrocarbonoxydans]